jgi:hypothetical protein
MKEYVGVDVQTNAFLASALVRDKCTASRPSRFTPGESSTGIHRIGGWVHSRAGLKDMEK